MEEETLLNKKVKISLETGFVLYGTLVGKELYGI
jgi:small nuclear ribonucleoprotein (snRNP)-like protein